MTKRIFACLSAAALLGAVLITAPAQAQTAVPDTVQIEDPFGDANTTSGDNVGPADASSVGDFGKIWFSHTSDQISVHVQTEAPPPATQGLVYNVYANPGGDFPAPQGCLRFITIVPGTVPNYAGEQHVRLVDRCNDEGTSVYNNGVEGEAVIEELPDGTGLVTMTFPRDYSPLLADGGSILESHGWSGVLVGAPPPVGFASFRLDDTVLGTEYPLTAEEDAEAEKKAKKATKPKKAKGKAKSKKKKKGAAACTAYEPGELGAESDTVTVTDEATEEKPVEQTVELEASIADATLGLTDESYAFFNVQVDSDAPDAGLYALFEFPDRNDYDISFLYADNSYAARSHAWNTVIELNDTGTVSSTGHGGESTASSEKLVGIKTSDCGGYTVETANWLGQGGEFTIKLWLGAAENDPQAPGEEPRDG